MITTVLTHSFIRFVFLGRLKAFKLALFKTCYLFRKQVLFQIRGCILSLRSKNLRTLTCMQIKTKVRVLKQFFQNMFPKQEIVKCPTCFEHFSNPQKRLVLRWQNIFNILEVTLISQSSVNPEIFTKQKKTFHVDMIFLLVKPQPWKLSLLF